MRVYNAIVRLPLKIGSKGEGAQPIRDLDTVRGFLSGIGPVALFDLPWMPVYLIICFVFHTYIGLTALAGADHPGHHHGAHGIDDAAARPAARRNSRRRAARLLEASRRNAEAITAMGMVGRIAHALERSQSQVHRLQSARQRHRRRSRRDLESAAPDAAIRDPRGRRLAGDQSAIDRGHHHRRLDPRRPRAGAGRSCDRQLARLCRRAAKLGAAVAFAGALAAAERSRCRCSRRSARWSCRTAAVAAPGGRRSSARTSISRSPAARRSASSGRPRRASLRWRACWSASGRRCAAPSGSTAPASTSGRRRRSAVISAICRRTSNCFPATWRRTSRALRIRRIRKLCWPRLRRPASMT